MQQVGAVPRGSSNRKITSIIGSLDPDVGDMVSPIDDGETLYDDLVKKDPNLNWFSSSIGLVIETKDLPGREYKQVKVLVDGQAGWTYSDYLRSIEP